MAVRIAMWSGPRNISTAIMYSWGNRADTYATDEPFYAHYLHETGIEHPGREEVLAAQERDWRKVAKWLTGPVPDGRPIWFQKHMTQHLVGDIDLDWLSRLDNAFLIRRPEEVVASFSKQRPDLRAWELGYERQAEIFDLVCERTGEIPPVLDAEDVLKNPRGQLTALCDRLDVAFDPAMLEWRAGPRSFDGVWAPYWYDAVHRSTGFAPWQPNHPDLDERQREIAEAARPFYQRLYDRRLSSAD